MNTNFLPFVAENYFENNWFFIMVDRMDIAAQCNGDTLSYSDKSSSSNLIMLTQFFSHNTFPQSCIRRENSLVTL